MSADFWAGYISGAAGIVLGNPLDVLKVRLQAGATPPSTTPVPSPISTTQTAATPNSPISNPTTSQATPSFTARYLRPFLLGTAAPVLGYGALNAVLFVSYNRTEAFLNNLGGGGGGGVGNRAAAAAADPQSSQGRGTNLLTTWLAGAVGGLATWAVSTPTELVKCRAQLQVPASPTTTTSNLAATTATNGVGGGRGGTSSWAITKSILRAEGLRGLYFGGGVTALRDSIGYGFYFWGYELCSRWMAQQQFPAPAAPQDSNDSRGVFVSGGGIMTSEAARVLLCGGLAGIITWASIFPLDVVKTRVQTQVYCEGSWSGMGTGTGANGERAALLGGLSRSSKMPWSRRRLGAWEVAKETYREGGLRPFFRGLTVCSVRAFFVNAVQWAVYEWIMAELGQGRRRSGQDAGGRELAAVSG